MEILKTPVEPVPPSQLVLARALAREVDSGAELNTAIAHMAERFNVSTQYLKLVWDLNKKGIISL